MHSAVHIDIHAMISSQDSLSNHQADARYFYSLIVIYQWQSKGRKQLLSWLSFIRYEDILQNDKREPVPISRYQCFKRPTWRVALKLAIMKNWFAYCHSTSSFINYESYIALMNFELWESVKSTCHLRCIFLWQSTFYSVIYIASFMVFFNSSLISTKYSNKESSTLAAIS